MSCDNKGGPGSVGSTAEAYALTRLRTKDALPMLEVPTPVVIRPAQDPRCPICGSAPRKAAERLNRGVMLGTYVDAADHIWDTKWIPEQTVAP
jgi:hypothetical protein